MANSLYAQLGLGWSSKCGSAVRFGHPDVRATSSLQARCFSWRGFGHKHLKLLRRQLFALKPQCKRSQVVICRLDASLETHPPKSPPESWPIEPPLEKVEHERYLYPANTLPGYVSKSKDPRVPVKHKTTHLHVRGAVGCSLSHWIGEICAYMKLDGWVKELDTANMEIVVSGVDTAIDWLIGTLYRHPPDAKVFQVVESPFYEPIEKGFVVYEIDTDWVPGGHEELRGTDSFEFFGEDTMRMLWEVMYQDPDQMKREQAQAEKRAHERALAEAEEKERAEEAERDPYGQVLARALEDDDESSSGLDDDQLQQMSYQRLEREQKRRAVLQKGGFFGLDAESESELLGWPSIREEDLYKEDGGTESEDDDSTLQMLIESIGKSEKTRARGRGRGLARIDEGPRRGNEDEGVSRDMLGLEELLERGERSEEISYSASNPPRSVDAQEGASRAENVIAQVEPPQPRRRGRPRKNVTSMGASTPQGLPPPLPAKPKRARRKKAAEEDASNVTS